MLRNIIWTFSGSLFHIIIQVLVTMVFARNIPKSAFGEIAIILIVVEIATFLSNEGIGQSLISLNLNTKKVINEARTLSFISTLIVSMVIWFISEKIANYFNFSEAGYMALKLYCLVLIIVSLSKIDLWVLQQKLKFKQITIISKLSYFSGYAILGINLAINDFGVLSIVYSALLMNVMLLLTVRLHNKSSLFHFEFPFSNISQLFRNSKRYSMMGVLSTLATKGDYLVVGKLLGNVQLGLYERSYKLITFVNIFTKSIESVIFPTLAYKKDKSFTFNVLKETILISSILVIPLCILIFFNSELIVTILYGDKWLDAVPIFAILSLSIYFRTTYKIFASMLKSDNELKQILIANSIYAALVLSITYLLSGDGIIVISIGIVGVIVFHYILLFIFLMHYLHFPLRQAFSIHIPLLFISLTYGLTSYILWYLLSMIDLNSHQFFICHIILVIILSIIILNIKPIRSYLNRFTSINKLMNRLTRK